MADEMKPDEREVLRVILDGLHQLDDAARARILKTARIFFGIEESAPSYPQIGESRTAHTQPSVDREPRFSERTTLSPKAFLLEKQPRTDVERVTCIAYYLTHYRDTPFFTTLDISKLNTEAAQLKLSNAAHTVSNAMRAGLLAPAEKGAKQISAFGERLADALPNRDAIKGIIADLRARRLRKRPKTTNHKTED